MRNRVCGANVANDLNSCENTNFYNSLQFEPSEISPDEPIEQKIKLIKNVLKIVIILLFIFLIVFIVWDYRNKKHEAKYRIFCDKFLKTEKLTALINKSSYGSIVLENTNHISSVTVDQENDSTTISFSDGDLTMVVDGVENDKEIPINHPITSVKVYSKDYEYKVYMEDDKYRIHKYQGISPLDDKSKLNLIEDYLVFYDEETNKYYYYLKEDDCLMNCSIDESDRIEYIEFTKNVENAKVDFSHIFEKNKHEISNLENYYDVEIFASLLGSYPEDVLDIYGEWDSFQDNEGENILSYDDLGICISLYGSDSNEEVPHAPITVITTDNLFCDGEIIRKGRPWVYLFLLKGNRISSEHIDNDYGNTYEEYDRYVYSLDDLGIIVEATVVDSKIESFKLMTKYYYNYCNYQYNYEKTDSKK